MTSSGLEAQLRAVSLRVTRPRLAVLGALRDHPHADTDTVIALARAALPTVSTRPSTTCCARSPTPA